MKTLYFEGAGCFKTIDGDIDNCRIRTAFTNNQGKKIYLEILGNRVTKNSMPKVKHLINAGFIDIAHYITDDKDDENKNRIKTDKKIFEYNQEEILKFVNSLDCNFKAVQVLPDLAGYRVFGDNNVYNYGDEFEYNEELTKKRTTIYNHFYELEKAEGKKYPNFSLYVNSHNKNLHLIRHFNGYNKYWEIDASKDNWEAIEISD